MEAAASLTTLIAFTLQSAKFVYQSIEGIRDGPSILTNSTKSIRQLEGLLQQLLELIRRSEQHRQYHDATSWNLLEEKISHCSKDLKEASGKLKALSPDDAKNRVDKAWKRIRLSLKESFFTWLDARIKNHVADLGLQLDIINRDARQIQHNNASQASLHDIQIQLDSQTTAVKNEFFQKAQEVESSLQSMAMFLETANRDCVENSKQMNKGLQNTSGLIIGHLDQNKEKLQQQTQLIANQITARIDMVQDISAGQSKQIVELLRQIHGYLKTESGGASSADCNSGFKPWDDEDEITSERGGLSAAIDRLCLLASNKATTYYSDEAEGIIGDLEHVLNALSDYDTRQSSRSITGRKRSCSAVDESTSVSREIKKIRGVVTASRGVEVSESSAATTKFGIQQRTKYTKRSVNVYDLVGCRAVITIKTSSHNNSMRTTAKEKEPIGSILEAVEGNISLLARGGIRPTKISASFEQRITSLGFDSPHPRLSFHPIVPHSADIFTAVEEGDIDWMLELLNTGRASLRDCDPEGRSLLNYAIFGGSLAACRYLIDRGADVNSMEKHMDAGSLVPGLYQPPCVNSLLPLRTDLAIRHCLLEADADPLLSIGGARSSTMLDLFLAMSHADLLVMTLRHGKEFIDLKSRDEEGRDYFLRMFLRFLCGRDYGNDLSQNIRLLVSHGADIGVRDMYGIGCLHALISNLWSGVDHEWKIDPLCLLVQLGADIHAVTHSGYSVTEWAHFLRQGHVWEEVLEKSGYDVEWVYSEDYNRGWSFSDDVFAPKEGHPRQRGCFCSVAYYNVRLRKLLDRMKDIREPNRQELNESEGNTSDGEQELGKFESETTGEEDEDEQDDLEEEEPYNDAVLKDHEQLAFHEFIDEGALESDSDEEMGGVPVTN